MRSFLLLLFMTFLGWSAHAERTTLFPNDYQCDTLEPSQAPENSFRGADVCRFGGHSDFDAARKYLARHCVISLTALFGDDSWGNALPRYLMNHIDWKHEISNVAPAFNFEKRYHSPSMVSSDAISVSAKQVAESILNFHQSNGRFCGNGYLVFSENRGGLVFYASTLLRWRDSKKNQQWTEWLSNHLKGAVLLSPALAGAKTAQIGYEFLRYRKIPEHFTHDEIIKLKELNVMSLFTTTNVKKSLQKLTNEAVRFQFKNLIRRSEYKVEKEKILVISTSKKKHGNGILETLEQFPQQIASRPVNAVHNSHVCEVNSNGQLIDIHGHESGKSCYKGLFRLILNRSMNSFGGVR